MLVLTRRVGEQFYIGDGIVVTVLGSEYGRVKIGIEAPQDVRIVRGELLENLLDAINSESPRSVIPRERK